MECIYYSTLNSTPNKAQTNDFMDQPSLVYMV